MLRWLVANHPKIHHYHGDPRLAKQKDRKSAYQKAVLPRTYKVDVIKTRSARLESDISSYRSQVRSAEAINSTMILAAKLKPHRSTGRRTICHWHDQSHTKRRRHLSPWPTSWLYIKLHAGIDQTTAPVVDVEYALLKDEGSRQTDRDWRG